MSVLESLAHPAITTTHCAKMAYVYVRQSSVSQVTHHAESADLQYGLVDRSVRVGWPRDRVLVIDDDLGKSGADSDERHGFQRLIAETGLGHAGLVVSLDASRLAQQQRLAPATGALRSLPALIADAKSHLRPTRLPRPVAARTIWDHKRGGAAPFETPTACRLPQPGSHVSQIYAHPAARTSSLGGEFLLNAFLRDGDEVLPM
jgi:hypothetical protein